MGPPFVIDENFRLIGCRGNETRQIGEHSAQHFGPTAATRLLDRSLTMFPKWMRTSALVPAIVHHSIRSIGEDLTPDTLRKRNFDHH